MRNCQVQRCSQHKCGNSRKLRGGLEDGWRKEGDGVEVERRRRGVEEGWEGVWREWGGLDAGRWRPRESFKKVLQKLNFTLILN